MYYIYEIHYILYSESIHIWNMLYSESIQTWLAKKTICRDCTYISVVFKSIYMYEIHYILYSESIRNEIYDIVNLFRYEWQTRQTTFDFSACELMCLYIVQTRQTIFLQQISKIK